MPCSARIDWMAEPHERGVLDTSVIIDMPDLSKQALPVSSTVTTVTLAELSAGLHTTPSPAERASRAERLQRVEAQDRKSTRLNSSHSQISYAVFCLKKKKSTQTS